MSLSAHCTRAKLYDNDCICAYPVLGTLIRLAPISWAQIQESASYGINDIMCSSSLSSQGGGSNEAHFFLRLRGAVWRMWIRQLFSPTVKSAGNS